MNVSGLFFKPLAALRAGTQLAPATGVVVRFVSSLTLDEEVLFARAFLKAMASLLDVLPIAYSVRIETSDNRTVYEYNRPPEQSRT